METILKCDTVLPPELRNLPEVEYSAEDIERLNKIIDITDAQIAAGDHIPRTLAEFAAEHGMKAIAV